MNENNSFEPKHHKELASDSAEPLKLPSYKEFNRRYREMQLRRAAAGKLVLPKLFNGRKD